MTIEIRGTNTINKGAQLMLEATSERLGHEFALSAAPNGSAYEYRSRLGLFQTLHDFKSPRIATSVLEATPSFLKRRYGLVADSDIQGVVDASGFAYSDSFGTERIRREVLYGRRWKKRGVPKVLLPQAFGPFENQQSARWYSELLDQADLVFVRDRVSERYLSKFTQIDRLVRSPDFTIGLAPLQTDRPLEAKFLAVVPNSKMVSTGVMTEDAYVAALGAYIEEASSRGLETLVVVHEINDQVVSRKLAEAFGVETFHSPDPRELKSTLGHAEVIVASRFHAVVGGLSQGVKTIALGWSHKYRELLEDFGVPQWLATEDDDGHEKLRVVLNDEDGRREVIARKPTLLEAVDHMWELTIETLSSGAEKVSTS